MGVNPAISKGNKQVNQYYTKLKQMAARSWLPTIKSIKLYGYFTNVHMQHVTLTYHIKDIFME